MRISEVFAGYDRQKRENQKKKKPVKPHTAIDSHVPHSPTPRPDKVTISDSGSELWLKESEKRMLEHFLKNGDTHEPDDKVKEVLRKMAEKRYDAGKVINDFLDNAGDIVL